MSRIKKISLIKNMATFKNFDWDTTLRDNGNNIISFAESNIFYGRNGSGKTTISRIFRALETGRLSNKYKSPAFCVEFEDSSQLTQDNLANHNHCIRVFNEDFINENLKFFIDENANISSFAVLGDDNARIETLIEKLENEIGNKEQNTGLYVALNQAERDFEQANQALTDAKSELDHLLDNKSNNNSNGIRNQPALFGDQNYHVGKLKKEIEIVQQDNHLLSEAKQDELKNIAKEESKNQIQPISTPKLNMSNLSQQTKNLVEQQITISEPIQELLNNEFLQNWVYQGMNLHKDRETCAFCHNSISIDLQERLSKHFNQESENLRTNIQSLINNIQQEQQIINKVYLPEKNSLYFEFHKKIDEFNNDLQTYKNDYIVSLDKLIEQLNKRLNNIAHHFDYNEINFNQEIFLDFFNEINEIIRESNNYTNELSNKQSEARKKLRLNEVAKFINDIQYDKKIQEIESLNNTKEQKDQAKREKYEVIQSKKNEITHLKSQLNDEQKGAEKVNKFLTHFLTGQNLHLKAIEDSSQQTIKFEIYRGEEKAHNLSEGERSLIAFCYFIAKLSDLSTKDKNPIVFIDDPICSLDSNHIFFIFSLICESLFHKTTNNNGDAITQGIFSQLFISTHNLDFLKYTHRLPSIHKGKNRKFIIEKDKDVSCIKEMPKYLQIYTTEFNYLFEYIYKCSQISCVNDENFNLIFNFGNNARKFLEIYLYYQYPHTYTKNSDKDHTQRLEKFFGADNIPNFFVTRINNEYSHLSGGLERGGMPIEVSEMQLCAQSILDKIKEKNPEQFQALKDSIGV